MKRKITLSIVSLLGLLLLIAPVQGLETTPGQARETALQANLQNITLPPGFEITVFAANVPGARSLEWTPNGTLFVGTRNYGTVYALRDDNFDGQADGVVNIGRGLNVPNGVAFRDGSLYVAEINRILRYDNIEANLSNPPQPVVVYAGFPTEQHHGWKFIRFGPDGWLYVPVGAPCNICESVDPMFAALHRLNVDTGEVQLVASGIRNTVGFDWHPLTDELWFTDNGRDSMGDDLPPDELNHAPVMGLNFGYPYCHAGDIADPAFGAKRACAEFTPPAAKLAPHTAALGMRFYTGTQYPDEYVNQIFIAEHGSADRSTLLGYRVMLVRLDAAGKVLSYEPFAEGWLQAGAGYWGRPVDIEQLPDGSLLVSDDYAGAIYRIRYTLPKPTPTPSPTP